MTRSTQSRRVAETLGAIAFALHRELFADEARLIEWALRALDRRARGVGAVKAGRGGVIAAQAFDVRIYRDPGPEHRDKIGAIKVVHAFAGCTLAEAKVRVEVPGPLGLRLTGDVASKLAVELFSCGYGARVEAVR
jgi:ribosomal protein L7/L12